MAVDYTTTALLASIRRRGMVPNNSEVLSDADLLAIATDEIQTFMVPFLLRVREEYLVAASTQAITAGTAAYYIPERAVGGKLRDLEILSGNDYVPMARIEPERSLSAGSSSGTPSAYYLQGNTVVLVPTPAAGGTLRFKYHRRPSRLVASGYDTIGAVGSTTAVTTSATTNFTTASIVDVIKADPGFDSLYDSNTLGTASGTSLVFGTAVTGMAIGDYVCLEGESPVVQLPVELHPLLVQRVIMKALEANGGKTFDRAKAVCDEMLKDAHSLLAPRSEGSPRYLINYHGPGFNRRGGFRG